MTHGIFKLEIEIADADGERAKELGYDNDPYDEAHLMLAVLLAEEIVYTINNKLLVLCNDVFMWGCADSEEMTYEEAPDVFHSWYNEQTFGAIKWAAKKRNQQPQEPYIELIKKLGKWDDEWEALDFGDYNRNMVERRKVYNADNKENK